MTKFAENFNKVLSSKGITQQEMAVLLGTTQQTVSRWILGKNEPDLNTLAKICLYLDETPDSILGYDEIPSDVIKEYANKLKN